MNRLKTPGCAGAESPGAEAGVDDVVGGGAVGGPARPLDAGITRGIDMDDFREGTARKLLFVQYVVHTW